MKRKNSFLGRVTASVISTLALVHAVLLYGLIGENEILWLACGALALFLVMRPKTGFLLSFSLLGSTLLLAGLLKVTGLEKRPFPNQAAASISYDFLRGHQIFQPGLDITFNAQGGDLRAMTSPENAAAMAGDPHPVRFVTDSLGYRNDADYDGQEYILVGDSFVVSSATSQEDTLSAQLGRDHGLRAWNAAAVGGDLADYANWIRHTRTHVSKDAKILLFFFEGNDFEKTIDRDAELPAWKLWLKRYRNLMRFTGIGKFTYATVSRFTARPQGEQVAIHPTGAGGMGFYNKYVDVVRRGAYPNPGDFAAILAGIAPEVSGVFFIPDKYRVYHDLLGDTAPEPLPRTQFEYLKEQCDALALPLVDLTGPLTGEARRLMAQGRTVWYPDDTHWNAAGIAVAAREVTAFATGRATSF